MGPFETLLARRIRAYTDPATERGIDALAISRTAMSSRRADGRSQTRPVAGALGRRFADARWAVALVAVFLVSVVGLAIIGRLSDSSVGPLPTPSIESTPSPGPSATPSPTASAGGPIPDALRHSWERPIPVMPGGDPWGSGFISVASSVIDFGPEPGAAASRSAIAVAGPDTLTVTTINETKGCAIGDIGTYRWLLDGKDTVLTLTAIGEDPCAAREEALAGRWVRTDFPPNGPGPGEPTLTPGRHVTSAFDPLGDPTSPVRLWYTVPAGWQVIDDSTPAFLLHRFVEPAQGQPTTDPFVGVLIQPRIAADLPAGSACGPFGEAPGFGSGVDDLVAAIRARAGVVATPPTAVTIGGYAGRMLDLELAASWTGGCVGPAGPVVGIPIVVEAGQALGPSIGLVPGQPVRLILLDLTGGRTLAIAIQDVGTPGPAHFQALVAEVMPVVESFEVHPPAP
jgi:hypothetical protein